jgi:hypothetical protein
VFSPTVFYYSLGLPCLISRTSYKPGPRLPTLCPYHLKTGEAGPEAPIHILPADSARPFATYDLVRDSGMTGITR